MSPTLFKQVGDLRKHLFGLRQSGVKVGVVPTMGALHEGHLSLVRAAKLKADYVVVTIFVNPTQFGPSEDFERYPRDLTRDCALLETVSADAVFAPEVSEIYPEGEQSRVGVGALADGLCGAHRPGHFEGVCTVVAKFFNVLGPGQYFFGQKDYQQWKIIERMARDLLFAVDVVGCPIVREQGGLALSSRNQYLSAGQLAVAQGLSRGLFAAQQAYLDGERQMGVLRDIALKTIQASSRGEHKLKLEYLEMRDANSLSSEIHTERGEIEPRERPIVLLVAAWLGATRLIDNLVFEHSPSDLHSQGKAKTEVGA